MASGLELLHYVPSKIDAKGKFFVWDQDVAFAAFAMFLTGFYFGQAMLGGLLGLCVAYYYNKAKAGLHPDYILHLSYWIGNSPKFKELPESHNRHFYG